MEERTRVWPVGEKDALYSEIREILMTGDILLFHGLGWDSGVVQFLVQSQWTHVGMVVRIPEIGYPLLWESFPFKFVEDVILHENKSGARLVSLDESLAVGVAKGLFRTVAVRHLRVVRTPEMIDALREFIHGMFHKLQYPGDWEMLLEYLLGGFSGRKRRKPGKFSAPNWSPRHTSRWACSLPASRRTVTCPGIFPRKAGCCCSWMRSLRKNVS